MFQYVTYTFQKISLSNFHTITHLQEITRQQLLPKYPPFPLPKLLQYIQNSYDSRTIL